MDENTREESQPIRVHIVAEDPRFPLICINGRFTYGMQIDPETGDVDPTRRCICSAHSDSECICDLNSRISQPAPVKSVSFSDSEDSARLVKDRSWSEYPTGTKVHAYNGGHWIKTPNGWKWFCGATFPTPGGDAIGACVELPNSPVVHHP